MLITVEEYLIRLSGFHEAGVHIIAIIHELSKQHYVFPYQSLIRTLAIPTEWKGVCGPKEGSLKFSTKPPDGSWNSTKPVASLQPDDLLVCH